MTTRTRGRRSRPSGRGPRRVARRVWVNRFIGVGGITVDSKVLVDLLSSASEFMIFDCTILAVQLSYLYWTYTADATDAIRSVGAALLTGQENLDAADILEGPLDSGIGPSWLWQQSVALRTDAAALVSMNIVSSTTGGIRVRAKRRFTENNETLFLVAQNLGEAGDTELQLQGFCRTLLLVP